MAQPRDPKTDLHTNLQIRETCIRRSAIIRGSAANPVCGSVKRRFRGFICQSIEVSRNIFLIYLEELFTTLFWIPALGPKRNDLENNVYLRTRNILQIYFQFISKRTQQYIQYTSKNGPINAHKFQTNCQTHSPHILTKNY